MLKALVRQLLSAQAGVDARCRRAAAAREQGDWDAALHHYLAAVRLDDGRADAWNDLGLVYCARGEFAHAREAYARAIERNARLLPAMLNLGNLLREEYLDFAAAERCYRRALGIDAANTGALAKLGLSLQEQGRVEEAISCYRQALDLDPRHEEAAEYLLFALNLVPGLEPATVFAEHRRWAETFVDGLARLAPQPQAGACRLGFVSGDFRAHSTASFVLPLLAHLDRSRFGVFCYSASARTDEITGRFRSLASQWRDIHVLPDDAAAEMIRSDAIDVLVDLSGHTRGNRLKVFARKPAPVTMTWLGYLNTTGMLAMDYRITDARADPPLASDPFHSETPIRLPDTFWCYDAPADATEVVARLAAQSVTFGSCNQLAKLNDGVIALWSRVLFDVPRSRLIVMAVQGDAARERVASAFGRHGVETRRLDMRARTGTGEYWRTLEEIDIALDPFPYNGGATTCDCLWMGIPVVTLAGAFGFARSGASILGAAGLLELIAPDPAGYHSIAVGLARDGERLARLRAGLRERLRASVLMDGPRFARAFEAAVLSALRRSGVTKPC